MKVKGKREGEGGWKVGKKKTQILGEDFFKKIDKNRYEASVGWRNTCRCNSGSSKNAT